MTNEQLIEKNKENRSPVVEALLKAKGGKLSKKAVAEFKEFATELRGMDDEQAVDALAKKLADVAPKKEDNKEKK